MAMRGVICNPSTLPLDQVLQYLPKSMNDMKIELCLRFFAIMNRLPHTQEYTQLFTNTFEPIIEDLITNLNHANPVLSKCMLRVMGYYMYDDTTSQLFSVQQMMQTVQKLIRILYQTESSTTYSAALHCLALHAFSGTCTLSQELEALIHSLKKPNLAKSEKKMALDGIKRRIIKNPEIMMSKQYATQWVVPVVEFFCQKANDSSDIESFHLASNSSFILEIMANYVGLLDEKIMKEMKTILLREGSAAMDSMQPKRSAKLYGLLLKVLRNALAEDASSLESLTMKFIPLLQHPEADVRMTGFVNWEFLVDILSLKPGWMLQKNKVHLLMQPLIACARDETTINVLNACLLCWKKALAEAVSGLLQCTRSNSRRVPWFPEIAVRLIRKIIPRQPNDDGLNNYLKTTILELFIEPTHKVDQPGLQEAHLLQNSPSYSDPMLDTLGSLSSSAASENFGVGKVVPNRVIALTSLSLNSRIIEEVYPGVEELAVFLSVHDETWHDTLCQIWKAICRALNHHLKAQPNFDTARESLRFILKSAHQSKLNRLWQYELLSIFICEISAITLTSVSHPLVPEAKKCIERILSDPGHDDTIIGEADHQHFLADGFALIYFIGVFVFLDSKNELPEKERQAAQNLLRGVAELAIKTLNAEDLHRLMQQWKAIAINLNVIAMWKVIEQYAAAQAPQKLVKTGTGGQNTTKIVEERARVAEEIHRREDLSATLVDYSEPPVNINANALRGMADALPKQIIPKMTGRTNEEEIKPQEDRTDITPASTIVSADAIVPGRKDEPLCANKDKKSDERNEATPLTMVESNLETDKETASLIGKEDEEAETTAANSSNDTTEIEIPQPDQHIVNPYKSSSPEVEALLTKCTLRERSTSKKKIDAAAECAIRPCDGGNEDTLLDQCTLIEDTTSRNTADAENKCPQPPLSDNFLNEKTFNEKLPPASQKKNTTCVPADSFCDELSPCVLEGTSSEQPNSETGVAITPPSTPKKKTGPRPCVFKESSTDPFCPVLTDCSVSADAIRQAFRKGTQMLLSRYGIHTVGDIASMPSASIASKFQDHGLVSKLKAVLQDFYDIEQKGKSPFKSPYKAPRQKFSRTPVKSRQKTTTPTLNSRYKPLPGTTTTPTRASKRARPFPSSPSPDKTTRRKLLSTPAKKKTREYHEVQFQLPTPSGEIKLRLPGEETESLDPEATPMDILFRRVLRGLGTTSDLLDKLALEKDKPGSFPLGQQSLSELHTRVMDLNSKLWTLAIPQSSSEKAPKASR